MVALPLALHTFGLNNDSYLVPHLGTSPTYIGQPISLEGLFNLQFLLAALVMMATGAALRWLVWRWKCL